MAEAGLYPYLNFQDQTREAMTFYQTVFGGELTLGTYGEMGMSNHPSNDDRIMHASLSTPNGMMLMASDLPEGTPFEAGTAVLLALAGDDEPTLRGYFEALAKDGSVQEPLEKAPWGDYFGMCTDRFGMSWMVNIAGS